MKNFNAALFTILLGLTISSCSKDPCTGDILGVYTGTCSTNGANFEGDLTVTASANGDYDLLLRDELINSGAELIEGVASEDCGKITIPLQNVTDGNTGFTVSGEFNISGNSLTGQIELVSNGAGGKCSYNMTKR